MKIAEKRAEPDEPPPLKKRLQTVKSSWRRTFGDYFLSGFAFFVAAAIFVLALLLGLHSAEPSERETPACTNSIPELMQVRTDQMLDHRCLVSSPPAPLE